MNIQRMKYFFLLIAVCTYSVSFSQKKDTVLKSQTIEVIQSYKPQVKQASKPVFTPDLPPKDNATPIFQYDVPQQALYYSYAPPALRPLALSKDSSSLPYPNYVKLGGGNLSTVYLDAGVGGLKGENYNTAIHLHHLQQQGLVKYQKTALSGIEATGNLSTKKLQYNGAINILRNQYALYGDFVDTGSAAPKNTYTGFSIALDAANKMENNIGIDYHPAIKLGVYGRKDVSEKHVDLELPVSKKLNDNFTISAAINMKIASVHFGFNNSTVNNNILQFAPKVAYQKDGLQAHLAAIPTLGKDGNNYILPDVYLGYKLPATSFKFFAGWQGSMQQNTFELLTAYNPYLADNYLTKQTEQTQIFGGVSIGIGNAFNFTTQVTHRDYKNYAMFMNNYGTNVHDFYLSYDPNVKAVSVEASARYDIADIFSLKVGGAYYDYYQKSFAHVWQEPTMRLNVDFSVHVLQGLNVTAYSRLLDGIYVLNEAGQSMKLNPAFEIGGAAEYQIVPRLSAFLTVNNLFNNKYQRWYHYQVYGFNIFGGLRLKF